MPHLPGSLFEFLAGSCHPAIAWDYPVGLGKPFRVIKAKAPAMRRRKHKAAGAQNQLPGISVNHEYEKK